jgi:hypothetical protein
MPALQAQPVSFSQVQPAKSPWCKGQAAPRAVRRSSTQPRRLAASLPGNRAGIDMAGRLAGYSRISKSGAVAEERSPSHVSSDREKASPDRRNETWAIHVRWQ